MDFDDAVAAGLYSTLCGVLAGFAVTGLIFVVTSQQEGRPKQSETPDSPLALLFTAFVGLSLSSLGYALLAGEPATSMRLAGEHVITGTGFAAASLALLLAVMKLVVPGADPRLTSWLRMVVGRAGPLVVWLYLAEGARHVVHVQTSTAGGTTTTESWMTLWSALAAMFVAQVACLIWGAAKGAPAAAVGFFSKHIASICLMLPALGTAAAAATPTMLPNASEALPMWVIYVTLLLGTALSSLFILCVGGRD